MITSKERIEAFETEFKALLKKHNVELSIETPYMVAIMSSVYDEQQPNKLLKQFAELDMGG